MAMDQLSERLLAEADGETTPELDTAVSSTVREGLFQDDTAAIATHTVMKRDDTLKSRLPFKKSWYLLATPLLTASILVLFLATSPGTVGSFSSVVYSNPALIVIAAVAQIIALVWMLALALRIFAVSKHISMGLILPGLDRVDGLVARIALELSVIHAGCVLIYIGIFWHLSSTNDDGYSVPFSPLWLQFGTFVLPLALTLTPYMTGWQLRRQFWQLFGECISCVVGWSPLVELQFRHILLTDVMTSAMPLVSGVSYSICHFATSSWLTTRIDQATNDEGSDICGKNSRFGLWGTPVLTCLPFWLRFVQCLCLYRVATRHGRHGWARWQHVANAGKYLISILAVWNMAALKLDSYYLEKQANGGWERWHVSVLILIAFRTMYVYAWDIRMDWALARGTSTHRFLRNRLLFRPISVYYVAMGANLAARLVWILTINSQWCYAGCSGLFAFIEIFRRGQWLIYRVEHEQLKLTSYFESFKETEL